MNFCGIKIDCFKFEDIVRLRNCSILVTVNAEAIVRSQTERNLLNIINQNHASIDGQIPLWLYKRKYPDISIEKLSGSDLIYSLSDYAAKNGLRVFLLGGAHGSNSASVFNLKKRYPSLMIDGYSPPFSSYPFSDAVQEEICARIKEFMPNYIFVGFGMGKQEFWENDNIEWLKSIGVRLMIGCGGSFDFVSGKIRRAPVKIQKMGLEGFWRLVHEFRWFRIKRILLSTKIFYYYWKSQVFS